MLKVFVLLMFSFCFRMVYSMRSYRDLYLCFFHNSLEFDNPERPECNNLLSIYQLMSGKTKEVCFISMVNSLHPRYWFKYLHGGSYNSYMIIWSITFLEYLLWYIPHLKTSICTICRRLQRNAIIWTGAHLNLF